MMCMSHNSFDTMEKASAYVYFFLSRVKLITNKLQEFQKSRLKAAFRKRFSRYNDLVCYKVKPVRQPFFLH